MVSKSLSKDKYNTASQSDNKQADRDLVRQITGKKDKVALSTLYKKYFDDIYRFVYSRVGNREHTEDIVSETWLALLKNLEKFDGSSKFMTFALGFALNMIRRFYQTQKVKTEDLNDEFIFVEDKPSYKRNMDLIDKLETVLKKLSQNYRDILTVRFIQGKNIKETAQILDLTEANVRVLQHRAIKKAQEMANTLLKT